MNYNINILTLFFFYFFVIFSITGIGLFFSSIVLKEKIILNIGYKGIFGLFIVSIYSYISSNFFPHSLLHNLIFNLFGLFFFIYYFLIEKKKNDYYIFVLVFLVLFISILAHKAHDDFGYYHFPYTYFLTQFNSVFGLGFYDLGFRTPSSIFYINSLFYLPGVLFYLFNITAILIFGFSNIILLKNIINSFKYGIFDFIFFLSLIIFVFINIFFYRISEHGTDLSSQILILILILDLLIIVNYYKTSKNKVGSVLIFISLIISLKAFYILYSVFIFYLFYFLIIKKNFFQLFFKNYLYILLSFILIFLVLITNFQITGCFIYPLSISCFSNFPWAIDIKDVESVARWYEQWSKAGAGPNFRVENPEIYIDNFNWVKHWFFNYFIGKGSDLFIGLIFLFTIIFFIFYSKIKKNTPERNYKIILAVLGVLLFEWFYNHPAFRYGGYSLIVLIFGIPLSIILEKFRAKDKIIMKKCLLVLIITFTIFLTRNVNRLHKEILKYDYNIIKHSSYVVSNDYFGITNKINKLITTFNNCNNLKSTVMKCPEYVKTDNIVVGKFFGKYYFKSVND
jgi:hypothetical protein